MAAALTILAVLAVLATVAVIAVAVRRGQERDNQVVPGKPTSAPSSWAGAHTTEARLHRRLRDAVRGLHALPRLDPSSRAEVERHVLALDDRLVAVSSLPAPQKERPLAALEDQVRAVEQAVGAFATDDLDGSTDVGAGLSALSERLDHLAAAHEELDALERPDGDLDDLASQLAAERAERARRLAATADEVTGEAPSSPPEEPGEARPSPG